MIYNGYVVMQRRKYEYIYIHSEVYIHIYVQCSIKLSYDEIIIIIIIPFLFFTSKLKTQKQNTKIAHKLQNKAIYKAIIIIKIKNNNEDNSGKCQ
jgi:hypothetical protein